eukprot:COSAG06_NODE_50391_length_319_cov_0.650000_1_plen_31_part_10
MRSAIENAGQSEGSAAVLGRRMKTKASSAVK